MLSRHQDDQLCLIYRVKEISVKVQVSFLDIGKMILTVYIKTQNTQNSQHDTEEEDKVGGLTLSSIKTYREVQ